ncbi:MAG TPA: hypothetical protein VHV08_11245, partial [Pirellulales bacterium]|nr:hypothetical protein [Pirellulales bacterium]
MRFSRKLAAVGFLTAVAVGGYLLRGIVPAILAEYEQAERFNPVWGQVYLGLVVASGAACTALAAWALWTLVGNSLVKARRR